MMKKEADIMKEREEWIEKISKEIKKRTFEMTEKKVEQNQWEYWEKQFIPLQQTSINDVFEEVFVENDQKDLEENFPNIFDEIWTRVFRELKEELAEFGFKLGYTKRREEFGIGALDSELIEIGENNSLSQKIKKFFSKPEMTVSSADEESSEKTQETEEMKELEEEMEED